MLYRHQKKKKNDEPNDMVRILSEMEKCTSNITFHGWPFDHWNDHRERDTSYHKAKKNLIFRLVKKYKWVNAPQPLSQQQQKDSVHK